MLVVNVASQCGYTEGHYKGLKRLFDILNFSNKLAILAFPCNQFGGQEPGTREDIRDVAFGQYGVRFTMMDKVDVKDANVHPVWKFLTGNIFFSYYIYTSNLKQQLWELPNYLNKINKNKNTKLSTILKLTLSNHMIYQT